MQRAKAASHELSHLEDATRNRLLEALAEALIKATPEILAANAKDLNLLAHKDPTYDRLLLNEQRLSSMASDVRKIAKLPSPIDRILFDTVRPNGLQIQKISVPLGVVGVVYESRPNVTVDVFSLCFKAGNACVLKGGKEAEHSNQALAKVIHSTLLLQKINQNALVLLPPHRDSTLALLEAVGLIDVCIPRGSQGLIDYVRQHARIPVIETGSGVVHTYFDRAGDLNKGQAIINNAKTRRVSVCNALDTLIVHQDRLGDLNTLVAPLASHRVELLADEKSHGHLSKFYPADLLKHAQPGDFGCEFLSYKMSLKTVSSLEEAINHIMSHTSGHSEAIITEDRAAAKLFMQAIDAAVVYVNASTAFTDGGEFGMGAEIGISTQKLHARGPMGLDALTSYKWWVTGDGQIRAE